MYTYFFFPILYLRALIETRRFSFRYKYIFTPILLRNQEIINDIPKIIKLRESDLNALSINKNKKIKIPELFGLTRNVAESILKERGINYKISGTGTVVKQSIKEGSFIDYDTELIINLF